MENLKRFLKELNNNTGVKFQLVFDDGTTVYSSENMGDEFRAFRISLGEQRGFVRLPKSLESCAALLIYTIENKYKESASLKEQLLIDIIENKHFTLDDKSFSFINRGSTLFIVDINGSKQAALNIIRQLYDKEQVFSLIYKDYIIIYGVFDEIVEHGESIKESIVSELYCKCKICYSGIINETKDLLFAYEKTCEGMLLSKKFKNKEEIFRFDRFELERIVYNVNDRVKEEIKSNTLGIFDSFDSEIINTIEEFFKNNLNLSDTSKKLYVHRNTLIYRLDKIAKETGLDIRKFNDASLFKVAFLIWKESSR